MPKATLRVETSTSIKAPVEAKKQKLERVTLVKGPHKVAVQIEQRSTGEFRTGYIHFLEHGTARGQSNTWPTYAEAQKQRDRLVAELTRAGFARSAHSGRHAKADLYRSVEDLIKVLK